MPSPRFQPGERPVGRAKGTQNRVTVLHREFCEQLITDEEYQLNLLMRLRSGRCHPAVETLIWYYARGKPRETLDVTNNLQLKDISMMSSEELTQELIEQASAIEHFLSQPHDSQDQGERLIDAGPETNVSGSVRSDEEASEKPQETEG